MVMSAYLLCHIAPALIWSFMQLCTCQILSKCSTSAGTISQLSRRHFRYRSLQLDNAPQLRSLPIVSLDSFLGVALPLTKMAVLPLLLEGGQLWKTCQCGLISAVFELCALAVLWWGTTTWDQLVTCWVTTFIGYWTYAILYSALIPLPVFRIM